MGHSQTLRGKGDSNYMWCGCGQVMNANPLTLSIADVARETEAGPVLGFTLSNPHTSTLTVAGTVCVCACVCVCVCMCA